ncbi:MAG: 1,4-dihydroxy-6-naphthoate synthase, partial [Chlamydiia bacterium]|nr:1,4-dihydroxy-6-naphthoate synthase [Chlamydiia bacterium]
MIIPCAFSPCPNDTFLFHALLEGLIDSDITLIPELADIEELNRWAEQRRHPLMKVSFACLPSLLRHYQVLPVGAAIGYGCG